MKSPSYRRAADAEIRARRTSPDFRQLGAECDDPPPYYDAANEPPNLLARDDAGGICDDVSRADGLDPTNDRFSFKAAWGGDGEPDFLLAAKMWSWIGLRITGNVQFQTDEQSERAACSAVEPSALGFRDVGDQAGGRIGPRAWTADSPNEATQ